MPVRPEMGALLVNVEEDLPLADCACSRTRLGGGGNGLRARRSCWRPVNQITRGQRFQKFRWKRKYVVLGGLHDEGFPGMVGSGI